MDNDCLELPPPADGMGRGFAHSCNGARASRHVGDGARSIQETFLDRIVAVVGGGPESRSRARWIDARPRCRRWRAARFNRHGALRTRLRSGRTVSAAGLVLPAMKK